MVGHDPGGAGGPGPGWQARPPERLASAPQSLAVSPEGRLLAAGAASGSCFLWDWTAGGDNLARTWKAHCRPVTCLAFDGDDGAALFTAGEDGVVNAWCVLDLLDDADGASRGVRPLATWSEHHLPVTSLCVLPGGGGGSTRLVSASLDRHLILMEFGEPAPDDARGREREREREDPGAPVPALGAAHRHRRRRVRAPLCGRCGRKHMLHRHVPACHPRDVAVGGERR